MKKEAVEILSKSIVAAIPYIGSTVVSVWSDIQATQAKRKQERLEEFYRALESEIQKIKEQINSLYVSQTDFMDVFEQTAKHIVNERREEKRIMFRNILLKSITAANCSYDKTERYFRVLEQMNDLELIILRILQNPSKFNKEQGEIIHDKNAPIIPGYANFITYTGPYFFVEILGDLLKAPQEDIAESLNYLERNRIITENTSSAKLQTNGHPIHTLDNKLTPKGKDFMSFVLG